MAEPLISPSKSHSQPQPVISEEFDVPTNHSYQCRCGVCLTWWAQVGPEPDEDDYGPFSEAEVEAEVARLAGPDK